MGRDFTGKFIEDGSLEPYYRHVYKHLSEVACSGVPLVAFRIDDSTGYESFDVEAVVLPLSRDGTALDMLLSAIQRHRRVRSETFLDVPAYPAL